MISIGMVNTPNELLLALRDFLVTEGFTVDKYAAVEGDVALGYELMTSKNGSKFNFRSFDNCNPATNYAGSFHNLGGIAMTCARTFDAGSMWHQQAETASENGVALMLGAASYAFVVKNETITAYIKNAGDVTTALCFGHLGGGEQFATSSHLLRGFYSGSDVVDIAESYAVPLFEVSSESFCVLYADGAYLDNSVQVSMSSEVGMTTTTGGDLDGIPQISFKETQGEYMRSTSELTGITGLIPIDFYVSDPARKLWRYRGSVEGVHLVNMLHADHEEERDIGGTTYRFVANLRKASPVNFGDSIRMSGVALEV
ncbi:hypothetical protein P5E67_00800 [Vibrio parahaemolyticus]|nr:hypothetical protein [Vibrio parahaemolyticus]